MSESDVSSSSQPTSAQSQPQRTVNRILRTKLFVPQAHPALIARPRLLARLDEGAARKVTLVSAPAGFGKTTLLSVWLAQRGTSVGWVSLDERDNDPIRFWAYVIASLQEAYDDPVGGASSTMLQAPQPPPVEAVLTELLNDITGQDEVALLVLDDYHAITDAEIHQGVTFLIDHLPEQLRIVMSSRSTPSLPLALLRARRELVELNADDLRFTSEETFAFCRETMGLPLTRDQISALDSLTEGWIAGLQLAALALQDTGDADRLLATFSGSHRFVFDYLAQEVLSRQPGTLREFLLKTSVLTRMSGPLCDALTERDDGQATLEQLEQMNLFVVPLDQERRWYRYHHLFGDFLRARLQRDYGQERIETLHRRAGTWYAEHAYVPDAVHHALAAEDYGWAMALIEHAVPAMFLRGELRTLLGWIDEIPDSLLSDHVYLNMTTAWALLATGQGEAAALPLDRVEESLGATADGSAETFSLSPRVRGALGEISCIRASLAFNQMDLARVKELSRQAQTYLTDDVPGGIFNERLSLRAIAAFNLAMAYKYGGETNEAVAAFEVANRLLREDENHHLLPMSISYLADLYALRGELHRAAGIYREAVEEASVRGPVSPLSGLPYTGLGDLLYEWNDLDGATHYLERGLELGKQWSHWEILLEGYVGLGRIDCARDDPAQAQRRIDTLMDNIGGVNVQWIGPMVDVYRALFLLRGGDVQEAARAAGGFSVPQAGVIPYTMEEHALILVRVYWAQGQLEEAQGLLSRLIEGARAGQRQARVVEALALQALVLDAQKRRDAALACLSEALTLAEPAGFVRTFVDEGAPMRTLLIEVESLSTYRDRILESFGPPQSPGRASEHGVPESAQLLEPLTERETEVVALMAQGLTNQEIADRLFISINTVKTHAKNLYDKLGVRNRAQAALRATELGLV